MFKSYILVAIRNLSRHKVITTINVVGLALGITAFLLIMIWVGFEMSYDKYHVNKDRIVRLCVDLEAGSHMIYPMSMPEAAPNLMEEYPEIISAARLEAPGRANLKIGNESMVETGICHGDNSIFEIFDFPFVAGNPQNALTESFTAVITRTLADKYFNRKNPLDEALWIGGRGPYKITGVIEDIPHNSHFRFQVMGSFTTLYAENSAAMENWFHIQFYTYLLLAENADSKELEAKLPEFVEIHLGESLRSLGGKLTFFLQPLSAIHLHSDLAGEIASQSDLKYLCLFAAIAFFVLLIACINFVNLATANSVMRSREIGMRKIVGSSRHQIMFQFLIEAVILCFLAVLISTSLVEMIRPQFSELFGTYVDLSYLRSGEIAAAILLFSLFLGIAAGIYPAVFLSGLEPVLILKSGIFKSGGKSRLRSILVVFQFAVSIILVISTTTIFKQINYMKYSDPGFKKDSRIVIPGVRTIAGEKSLNVIRKAMSEIPEIETIGFSSLFPGRGTQKAIMFPEGFAEDNPQMGEKLFIDDQFLPTMGIELEQGRNFSAAILSDPSSSVLINQTAAKTFGWQEPLEKSFNLHNADGIISRLRVVGVVKDFHSTSLHTPIEPLIIYYDENRANYMILKINSSDIEKTLFRIKEKFKILSPDQVMTYYFLDETLNSMYHKDIQTGKLAFYFSLFAVVLGCLGLLGLTSFLVQNRTKEIGIRKVLGSSVWQIVLLLNREFCKLVIISVIIAWPISFLIMQNWLQNYAYHTQIGISVFIFSGIIVLVISLITVSSQTIRTARSNPVKALKYE